MEFNELFKMGDGMETDLTREMANMVVRASVKQTEDVLRVAINSRLGCDDCDITSLRGRLELKVFPDGIEIFCLDGVELIELHPPQFEIVDEGLQTKIIATRNYRALK